MLVLFRVQHFQKRRRSIPFIITAHLIDLVQQHQWIFYPGPFEAVNDPSRQSTDIGPAVSPDLRLVPDTSQTNSHVFLLQGAGHGSGDGSLSCPRRTYQTYDGCFAFGVQLSDCKEFKNPLLDLFQSIMVLIQNLLGPQKILAGFIHLIPGQIQQRLDIIPRHRTLR